MAITNSGLVPQELAPQALPVAWQAEQETVELIDIGYAPLNAPFYDQSILALRRSGETTITRLPLASLRELLAKENVSPPTGFIFHLGRCGSTLLANMLGAHPAVRAVKEPGVINIFLAETGLSHRSCVAEANDEILRTLIAAFGRGLHGGHFIVKFTGWTVADIERILGLFPATPAVFLWRPAIEVISSWMAKIPPWAWGDNRAESARMLNIEGSLPPADEDDLISYFSHVWLAEASAAYDMARRPRSMLTTLAYADLRDHPREVIVAVAKYFRIPASNNDVLMMTAQADRYSKGASGGIRYGRQGEHFRPSLGREQREIAEQITGQQELDLDRLARRRGLDGEWG